MDHIVRGVSLFGGEERPFPERTYTCRHCRYQGSGFGFLQKAPSGFLLQPHPMFPMGRKAFRYWLGILETNFPDYERLKDVGTSFYPQLPDLRQQMAGALTVMSYILDSRQDRRRYGNQAYKMDRVCLTILFEHHLRRIFDLPPTHTGERLLAHIEGADVEILDDVTLRRLLLPVFGEAKKVVDKRPTFEHWKTDPYFAIGLDAYNRFGHQEIYPELPGTDHWKFIDTHDLPADESRHTPLWWPVEDVL
jgi:hypothetical protein